MVGLHIRRRTQVAKGEVCKTFMQRFESARRLLKSKVKSYKSKASSPERTCSTGTSGYHGHVLAVPFYLLIFDFWLSRPSGGIGRHKGLKIPWA